jgi:hypothetical protein
MIQDMNRPVLPWWRVPMVWLMLGGPAAVVVAGFITLFIAIRWGDPPLPHTGLEPAEEPATQARNHVVTPRR